MAHLELGRCLRLLGDPLGDAQAHLETARLGLPGRRVVIMEMGRLAEDQGDVETARDWYRRAAELDEGSQEPTLALARLGCVGAGLASFEHARRLVRANGLDPAARRALASAASAAGFKEQANEAFTWLATRARPSWRSKAAQARHEGEDQRAGRVSSARAKRSRSRSRR